MEALRTFQRGEYRILFRRDARDSVGFEHFSWDALFRAQLCPLIREGERRLSHEREHDLSLVA